MRKQECSYLKPDTALQDSIDRVPNKLLEPITEHRIQIPR